MALKRGLQHLCSQGDDDGDEEKAQPVAGFEILILPYLGCSSLSGHAAGSTQPGERRKDATEPVCTVAMPARKRPLLTFSPLGLYSWIAGS
jgi:hypothetical protein